MKKTNGRCFFFYGNYDDDNIAFLDEIKDLEKQLNLTVTHVLEIPSKKMKSEPDSSPRKSSNATCRDNRDESVSISSAARCR